MEAAPTGLVTLVFTDVEGSTSLWEAAPEAMREALGVHDRVMRERLAAHHGYEVKTEGDAFMVCFQDSAAALAWCLDVQVRLQEAPWPEALLARPEAAEVREREGGGRTRRGLRVRMGLHRGEPDCRPDPVTGRMDYFGPMVNRSARVSGAAHGGQVLASGAVHEACQPALAGLGAVVKDLGDHALKGLARPERLLQVLPASLASRRFPPVRTLDVRRSNLGEDPTSLLGRERALAELSARVEAGVRLLTLVGAGGMGKTRVLRALGRGLLEVPALGRGGGVWFVDLTAATTRDQLAAGVGAELGVSLAQGDPIAQLAGALAGRGKLVLLLDNLEQVAEAAAATLRAWLQAAPELVVVATSRVPLDVVGEELFELDPLAEEVGVALFAARAQAVRRGWSLEGAGVEAVRTLVRRLDAIPLAIELAAARVTLFSPAKLLERLERSLDVLQVRGRDPRQATLRGAIDWSWNLLGPEAQVALARAAVFRGGFDLEAAEAVLGPQGLDLMEELRRQSLIQGRPGSDDDLRFFLFESVRQYLDERLAGTPEAADAEAAHAAYYAGRALEWAEALDSPRPQGAVVSLALEQENLLAVVRRRLAVAPEEAARAAWALSRRLALRGPASLHDELLREVFAVREQLGDPVLRTRICLAFSRACSNRGEASEAERALDCGRRAAGAGDHPELAIQAELAAGMNACYRACYREADRAFAAARERAEAAGLPGLEAEARRCLAFSAAGDHRPDQLLQHLESARALVRAHDLRVPELWLGIGDATLTLGRLEEAEAALAEAMAEAQVRDDELQRTSVLRLLGVLEVERGDLAAARDCLEQALALSRRLGTDPHSAFVQRLLALVDVLEGRPGDARSRLEEGRALLRGTGFWQLEAPLAAYLAVACARVGDGTAARLALDEAHHLTRDRAGSWQQELVAILAPEVDPGLAPPPRAGNAESYNLRQAWRVAGGEGRIPPR